MNHIITFHTISEALRLERELKSRNLYVKLRPVPRKLSSSCGNCAFISTDELEDVQRVIEEKDLKYDGIYSDEDC
ncbi:DUF3343 domain-containing protein [Lagierella sp.]|uniref:DUF3343 domain-containing protein n=1 Tax=Lagierella sp. TaxID=2849657 RepID=UPI00262964F3|nr:DUF3343 domain-containing protein [Lagierella sp.]